MLVTQENVAKAFKGLRAVLMQRLTSTKNQLWTKIAMRTQTTGEEEDYDFLLAIGGLQELIGEIGIENLRVQGFTIKSKEFHKTIGVPVSAIRRDKLSLLTPRIQMMADRANRLPNKLVCSLLGNGFADLDYTGKAFFAVDKQEYKKATKFTNLTTKTLTPTNFEDAKAKLRAMTDDKGESLELGDSIALIVAPENEAAARKIVIADTEAAGATNINKGAAELIVLPGLSQFNSGKYWFLQDTSMPIMPLIVQVEYDPVTNQVTNPEDSYVVQHNEFLFQVLSGINAGYAAPRLIIGNTGAGA